MDFSSANVKELKSLLSGVLGYAILAGSFLLKVPQIRNICASASVEGLSEMSFYTEVPLVTTHVVYNYLQANPFRSYGETCIILVQNLILVALLWYYIKPKPSVGKITSVILTFVSVAFISFYLPAEYQYILPLTNLPMLILSKCPQIYSNMMSKQTGQLSLTTNFLTFAGSLARVFTTIQDVGYDASLLCNCTTNAVLSGVLVIQIIIYNVPQTNGKSNKDENPLSRILDCLSCGEEKGTNKSLKEGNKEL